MHGRTYGSLNWRDRAKERGLRAERLNDTLAAYDACQWRVRTADLALSPYGVRLIPNDRAVHIHEDWPGLDRRKVSGSIWNPIGLAFLIALMRNPMLLLFVRLTPSKWKPEKTRCAHRTWKSAKQMVAASREPVSHRGIGRALEEDTAARDVLLFLKDQAFDRGAPVPLCRQQEALTGRSSEKRSYLVERGVAYPGAAIGHGGATAQEKRRATILDEGVNEAIMELRDLAENKGPPVTARDIALADELEGLAVRATWAELVNRDIFSIDGAPLKAPKVGPCKTLPRADVQAFALAEWFETNHRRAQMRKKAPTPTSGPCRRLSGPDPGFAIPGDKLACGWRGARCCRRVSCPLNDCRLTWTARSAGVCDDG